MSSKFEDEQKRRDPVEMKQMDIKDVNGEEFGCKEQKRLSNVKAGPSKLMLKLVELLAEKIEENSDDYLDERGIVSFLALIAKHADMENKIRIGETGVIKVFNFRVGLVVL
uniref:Condensin complex subunit 2 n=1 Tax=Meloidogyne incognita TaxID=6306 RepID=A0A914LXT6_MELIC